MRKMMTTTDNGVHFEAHRRALMGLAYRMLGSRAEAEDIVQDAYLFHAQSREAAAHKVLSAKHATASELYPARSAFAALIKLSASPASSRPS
jgi:hypothetical protein